jgi:hypothetical protein
VFFRLTAFGSDGFLYALDGGRPKTVNLKLTKSLSSRPMALLFSGCQSTRLTNSIIQTIYKKSSASSCACPACGCCCAPCHGASICIGAEGACCAGRRISIDTNFLSCKSIHLLLMRRAKYTVKMSVSFTSLSVRLYSNTMF